MSKLRLAESFSRLADVLFARKEDQRVAAHSVAIAVQLAHGRDDTLRQRQFRCVLLIGSIADERTISNLHRVTPAGYLDHRGSSEEIGELARIDGGGSHDDPQVGPPW